jgi:branched-subunit amino acid aminotransferase/4-amino-4-deoxychorismate lyase
MTELLALAVAGRGLVDPAEPVFHADDEGLLRGSAAFETLRVYRGAPFMLAEHLARLATSVAALALPPVEGELVERLAADVVAELGETDYAMRIYRTTRTTVVLASPVPIDTDALRLRGIALRTLDLGTPPQLLAGVKSTSYALPFAARRAAQSEHADDVLFRAGQLVLECATANIWLREGDTVVTPSLGPRVLPGITRHVVGGLAPDAGFSVSEEEITVDRLLAADEAFTSSSVVELMPVVEVDGGRIGDGTPGPAAKALQTALRTAALG